MRQLKRVVVTLVGLALLVLGAVLIVLPGPGVLGIVAGLAVLATEYAWARRLLVKAKDRARDAQQAAVASPVRTAASVVFALGMVVLGLLMIVIADIDAPVAASLVDRVWGAFTGSVLIVMGLVLLATTGIALRAGRQADAATGLPLPGQSSGATRYEAG